MSTTKQVRASKRRGEPAPVERRSFEVQLPHERYNWLRHRALELRVPASAIVELALEIFKEREESQRGSRGTR